LNQLTPFDVAAMEYYHYTNAAVAGVECLVSRTGYTGEVGFEIFCSSGEIEMIAEHLFSAGKPKGLVMVGLGARDSLRLEAGFSLYGHEISETVSPIEAGLAWTVKFGKASGFIGREALHSQKEMGSARRILFFKTGDRRIIRAGSAVLADDRRVGEVVSGTFSPILNEAIGSLLIGASSIGKELYAEIRGQAKSLSLTKPPFVPLKS
jgi:aminomethyltransferase